MTTLIDLKQLEAYVTLVATGGFEVNKEEIFALKRDKKAGLWYIVTTDAIEGDYVVSAFNENIGDFLGCPIYTTYSLDDALECFKDIGTSHPQSISL